MVNESRQEAISYPNTIFKKLREKSELKPVRPKGSRIKEQLKPSTASTKDEDVKALCKKYPVKPSENMEVNVAIRQGMQTQMDILRNEIKNKQTKMVDLCE